MTAKAKLKALFLFLTFQDKLSTYHYSIDSTILILLIGGSLATLELLASGMAFWLLQINFLLLFVWFAFIIYLTFLSLHTYDYLRAKS